MDESSLQVFIRGAIRFFSQVTDIPAKADTPYLLENERQLSYGYTGVIGVSGSHKGKVYFTSPNVLLRYLLLRMGENDTSQENMADLVCEVANTISGNAPEELGNKVMISVPSILDSSIDQIDLPPDNRSYVVPLKWSNYRAALVISPEP